MDLSLAVLTDHVIEQMTKRQISEDAVRDALRKPDEVLEVRTGRVVAHAMEGDHLLRVFVDVDRDPPEVVTVYKTSRIAKYRSRP